MGEKQIEREVITEFIELYRNLPCLWDLTNEAYKDFSQKKRAWDILATKLKAIDPTANAASAKKKIDNLRISYTRESKKVKESLKHTGSSTSHIHKPSLWYYELMTFLKNKNNVKRRGIDLHPVLSDDEDEKQKGGIKRKNNAREWNIEIKREKVIDAANDLLTNRNEINPFGAYVGKKMEEIALDEQRDLAEKLISEIVFLAKTNNLTFDTRIEIPLRIHHDSPHNFAQTYFAHSPPSTSSNSYEYIQTESPTSNTEIPAKEILKEMLVFKKHK